MVKLLRDLRRVLNRGMFIEPACPNKHMVIRVTIVVIFLQAVLVNQVVVIRAVKAFITHGALNIGGMAGKEIVAAFIR